MSIADILEKSIDNEHLAEILLTSPKNLHAFFRYYPDLKEERTVGDLFYAIVLRSDKPPTIKLRELERLDGYSHNFYDYKATVDLARELKKHYKKFEKNTPLDPTTKIPIETLLHVAEKLHLSQFDKFSTPSGYVTCEEALLYVLPK